MSGIQGRSSNEQVVSSGAKYTGLAIMGVSSFNPTWEELKKNNPEAKEPKYTENVFDDAKSKNGIEIPASHYTKTRLQVRLFEPNFKFYSPVTFWLEDRVRWNNNHDKVEWINKFGQTAWSAGPEIVPQYNWWSTEGARPAYGGEGVFTSFIQAWANTDIKRDQAIFDDFPAIAKGDIKQFRDLYEAIKKNMVKVLVGVKKVVDKNNNKTQYYQDTYTQKFDRPYMKDTAAWKSQLEGEYGAFKGVDWQNSFELKEYKVDAVPVTDSPSNFGTPAGAPAGATPGFGEMTF